MKMMTSARHFACLALCLIAASSMARLASANGRRVELKPLTSLPWSLSHVESFYSWQDDTTTFVYRVSVGARDLSHLVIGLSDVCSNSTCWLLLSSMCYAEVHVARVPFCTVPQPQAWNWVPIGLLTLSSLIKPPV